MIEKLKFRAPVDVPLDWKTQPGVVGLAFAFLGLLLVAGTALAVVEGVLSMTDASYAIVIALGVGALLLAFGVMAFFAERQDL